MVKMVSTENPPWNWGVVFTRPDGWTVTEAANNREEAFSAAERYERQGMLNVEVWH